MYKSRACKSIYRILVPGVLLLLAACGQESSTTITPPAETTESEPTESEATVTEATVADQITAATTLTAADWTAACETGDINSASGCYGDAGSEAFAKINRLGGNPLGYAGVTGSAANSLWIRQVGVGTSCTTTNAPLYILNTSTVDSNSTLWICGTELTNGSPVSFSAGLGTLMGSQEVDPSNSPAGILFSTISIGNMSARGNTQLTPNVLYFNGSSVLPTVYLFCISTTNTSTATPFVQAPQASFDRTNGC